MWLSLGCCYWSFREVGGCCSVVSRSRELFLATRESFSSALPVLYYTCTDLCCNKENLNLPNWIFYLLVCPSSLTTHAFLLDMWSNMIHSPRVQRGCLKRCQTANFLPAWLSCICLLDHLCLFTTNNLCNNYKDVIKKLTTDALTVSVGAGLCVCLCSAQTLISELSWNFIKR